jgi:hypothetical protein
VTTFRKSKPVETVHAEWWPADVTVTLKTAPTGFDLNRIESAVRTFTERPTGEGLRHDVQMTVHEAALTKLEIAIVGWTFRFEEDGTAVPLTRDNIVELDPQDTDYLLNEINRLWQPWYKKPAATPEAQRKEDFPVRENGAVGLPGQAHAGRPATGDVGGHGAPGVPGAVALGQLEVRGESATVPAADAEAGAHP